MTDDGSGTVAGGEHGWARAHLDPLALRGDESILDVGCGDGKITARLADAVPRGRVLGIDRSEERIGVARRAHGRGAGNLDFRVADAETLDVAGEFDLAVSTSAFHWVADHPPILRVLHRALKPGGRIFLTMGGRGTASVVVKALAELRADPAWGDFLVGVKSPYHFFGPEDYDVWLREAGFQPTRLELVATPIRHSGRGALEAWLRQNWRPYVDRIPEGLSAGFLRELAQRVAVRCAVEDGVLVLPLLTLEVEAVRR